MGSVKTDKTVIDFSIDVDISGDTWIYNMNPTVTTSKPETFDDEVAYVTRVIVEQSVPTQFSVKNPDTGDTDNANLGIDLIEDFDGAPVALNSVDLVAQSIDFETTVTVSQADNFAVKTSQYKEPQSTIELTEKFTGDTQMEPVTGTILSGKITVIGRIP